MTTTPGKYVVLAALILALASGCGVRPQAMSTSEYLSSLATVRIAVTPMPWTPTSTARPSATPLVTATPSPTRVLLDEIHIVTDLPAWLRDPSSPVLMAGGQHTPDGYGRLSFFLATTGERYDLPLFGIEYSLWLDNMHVGLLRPSSSWIPLAMSILSLDDGTILRIELNDRAVHYLNGVGTSRVLTFRGSPEDLSTFYLLTTNVWDDALSADGTYEGGGAWLEGELHLLEVGTDRQLQLSPTGDGFIHQEGSWAPTGHWIASLQEADEGGNGLVADRIVVYDAQTRASVASADVQVLRGAQLLHSRSGRSDNLLWSPGGLMLLFLAPVGRTTSEGFPCWFIVESGAVRCFKSVQVPTNENELAMLTWSATGQEIRYLSCNDDTKVSSILSYGLNERLSWVLEDAFIDDPDRVIVGYKASGDDAFYLLTHDTQCRRFDSEPQSPELGIYDAAKGVFAPLRLERREDGSLHLGSYPDRPFLWRPLVP